MNMENKLKKSEVKSVWVIKRGLKCEQKID